MTAVDEHQLRHFAHLLDFDGGQEDIVAQYHAGNGFCGPVGTVSRHGILIDAMPGQMQHPIAACEQGCDDLPGVFSDQLGHLEAAALELLGDVLGLLFRAGQFDEATGRVADYQYGIAYGRARTFAESFGSELAQHAAFHGQWFGVGVVAVLQ